MPGIFSWLSRQPPDISDRCALIRSRSALCTLLAGISIALAVAVHFFLHQRTTARPDDSGLWHRNPGTPLRVEARGSGRAWQFSYTGTDGILGTADDPVSCGDLRLPAGTDVVIQLRSDDYIYVFSCPRMKLKEIAVPNLEFSIAFRAERLGEYDLAMDPMCGFRLAPGETMGTLRVVSESGFCLWLEGRPQLH